MMPLLLGLYVEYAESGRLEEEMLVGPLRVEPVIDGRRLDLRESGISSCAMVDDPVGRRPGQPRFSSAAGWE